MKYKLWFIVIFVVGFSLGGVVTRAVIPYVLNLDSKLVYTEEPVIKNTDTVPVQKTALNPTVTPKAISTVATPEPVKDIYDLVLVETKSYKQGAFHYYFTAPNAYGTGDIPTFKLTKNGIPTTSLPCNSCELLVKTTADGDIPVFDSYITSQTPKGDEYIYDENGTRQMMSYYIIYPRINPDVRKTKDGEYTVTIEIPALKISKTMNVEVERTY